MFKSFFVRWRNRGADVKKSEDAPKAPLRPLSRSPRVSHGLHMRVTADGKLEFRAKSKIVSSS